MTDPVTASVSLGATVLGGLFGAAGSAKQSAAQQQQNAYQAGIALQNQQIAKQNEVYAIQSGEQEAAKLGMNERYKIGEIKAAQGASGFQIGKGTMSNVVAGQEQIAGLEQAQTRSNAAKQAYNYDIAATQAGEQAQMYTAAGKNVAAAAPINIASSILGTAGSVASKWSSFSTSGALNFG